MSIVELSSARKTVDFVGEGVPLYPFSLFLKGVVGSIVVLKGFFKLWPPWSKLKLLISSVRAATSPPGLKLIINRSNFSCFVVWCLLELIAVVVFVF